MVPFPAKEPSDVMFKLLGLMIEYTDRLAGSTDTMVGESPGQNTPAETSRNTMEQGVKVYQGIYKRIWRSEKEEFKKRHGLNALYLQSKFRFANGNSYVNQEDYRSNPDFVVPAADPNLVSDGQRVSLATTTLDAATKIPGFSVPEAVKRWLKAMKVDGIDEIYPGADKVPPLPNPKGQIEQMKLEGVKMKIDFERQKFMAELLSQRNLVQAQIVKLYAEVGKLMAETQTEKVKAKVEAFSAIVDALETHQNMMNSQIEAMSKGTEGEGDDGGSKRGGMEGVAAKPGNPGGAQALPAASPAGANGAMG
jgi:hypothetical protein